MPPAPKEVSPLELNAALRQPGAGVGAGIAIAVLTLDDSLTSTLSEVVTADHTIAIANNASSLAEQIVAINAGVVLVDAAAAGEDVAGTLQQLRRQFPDVVLLAAGGALEQSQLANMIAEGSVYRFVHKPVSGPRVRHFVDAALRRFDELRGANAAINEAQAAVAAAAAAPSRLSPKILIAGAGVFTAIVVIAWFASRRPANPDPTAIATPAASTSAISTAPASTPSATSTTTPTPLSVARDRELNALLDRAESALVANEPDQAALLLNEATKIDAANARLSFLRAQSNKTRERNALARAKNAAASGDYDRAFATLDAVGGADPATLSDARRALSQQQTEDRLRGFVKLAQERLASGAVYEPAGDNARFYAAAARTLGPRDAAALRIGQTVRERLLAEARQAALREDSAAMERLLGLAQEDGVSRTELESIRSTFNQAREAKRGVEITRVASLIRQRVGQDRLLEPGDDSAQFWLAKLRELSSADASTLELTQLLAGRLVEKSRQTLASGDLEVAQRWLRAAESVGGRGTEVITIDSELKAQLEKRRRDSQVVGANSLQRLRFVEPTYPAAAAASKVSGWVDLEFTVLVDGSVGSIQIVGAQPQGVFEDTARGALTKWKFAPVVRDGTTVEQRAKLRMRFKAPE